MVNLFKNPLSLFLLIVGIIGVVTTRVPSTVDPVIFWLLSSAFALAIAFVTAGVIRYPFIRQHGLYIVGWILVVFLLALAIYIVATLPPYVPPL